MMDHSKIRASEHAHTLIMNLWLLLSHTLGGSWPVKHNDKISVAMWFPSPCTCQLGSQWGFDQSLQRRLKWQCLERCFQKDTVKKLWMLYRFNLQIQVSYTCVANHHRSIILWSPIQFRVSRSPRAPQPYPNPDHSHHKACLPSSPEVCRCVCVLLCVHVYVCRGRLQTKLNTLAAGSCESVLSQSRGKGRGVEKAWGNASEPKPGPELKAKSTTVEEQGQGNEGREGSAPGCESNSGADCKGSFNAIFSYMAISLIMTT